MKTLVLAVGVVWSCAGAAAQAQTGTFLDRTSPTDLRIAHYNVNWDSIFPDSDPNNSTLRCCNRVSQFRRIIAAINPDIMTVQEINSSRSPSDVTAIFDAVLPLPGGAHWHGAIGYSNVTVSRWPLSLTATQTVPAGDLPQCMSLTDLPDATFPSDIYLMNEHYKCCSGYDARRQKQSDALVNWMRDARTAGGSITLAEGTPMIVLGDLNIVESLAPLNTLLCGDIANNATYGPDSPPDWDGTCATDAHPLHNMTGPADYTWRNDGSSFAPSRLDFVIYSDSIVTVTKKFILNTTTMSPADLAATGLQQNDVLLTPPGYYDHFPVVVDFQFSTAPPVDGDVSLDGVTNGGDITWFVSLVLAGPSGDAARIPHGDFNANSVVDLGDVPAFANRLLAL